MITKPMAAPRRARLARRIAGDMMAEPHSSGLQPWNPTPNVTTSPLAALRYAQSVVRGPFPQGEDAIARDPGASFQYARDVLRQPFPKGEYAIMSNKHFRDQYLRLFPQRRNQIQSLY